MSLVRIAGGLWLPQTIASGDGAAAALVSTDSTIANDQEELQLIGRVQLASPSATPTFGTSGSTIGWLPGASVTFNAVSTVRVGVKKSSTFDNANGPPGRATAGSASFDVYKDLVAGTDTITSTTWLNTAMATGTGFTVAHGDKLAVCFYLSKSSGTTSMKIRNGSNNSNPQNEPFPVLITSSGTVFSNSGTGFPNVRLTFDDGSIGWLSQTQIFSVNSTDVAVSNGNIYGNVFQLPFDCTVDCIASDRIIPSGDYTAGLWSTPAGTPTAMTNGTVNITAKNQGTSNGRFAQHQLPGEVSLTKNTAYFMGFKPTTASGLTVATFDVDNANDLQSWGLDSNTYAGLSTAGGSVAQQNSGKRRAAMSVRVSQIDIPVGLSRARAFAGAY